MLYIIGVIIFIAVSVQFILFLLLLPLIFYLINRKIKTKRTDYKTFKTTVDIRNRKIVFETFGIFKNRNKTVPFSEISSVKFERIEEFVNRYDNETLFKGYVVRIFTKSQKSGMQDVYDVVMVEKPDDALALVNWFEQIIGLQNKSPWNYTESEKTQPTSQPDLNKQFTFRKSVFGKNFKPENFDVELYDARLYEVFESGNSVLKMWTDIETVHCYIETAEKYYLIERTEAKGKTDSSFLLRVSAMNYSVTEYSQKNEAAKLAINNIRSSLKGYDAFLQTDFGQYKWKFNTFGFKDISAEGREKLPNIGVFKKLKQGITDSAGFRNNGGFYKNENDGIAIFSKFLKTDSYGQPAENRKRNQIDIEGYLEFPNQRFDPVLVFSSLYLYEMELKPMPTMTD